MTGSSEGATEPGHGVDEGMERAALRAAATYALDRGMRVCVDARMLGTDGTGVARYARTLVQALTEAGTPPLLLHADVDGAGRIARWFASARLRDRMAVNRVGCVVTSADRSIAARDIFREAHTHFNLYGRLLPIRCEGPPGIMHWTYPVPVIMKGWRNIYTIHDVIPLNDRSLTPINETRHRKMLTRIARQADRLVTVSADARDQIVATLGCAPALVVNTSQAVSIAKDIGPLAEGGAAREYFLFCGSIEPRKNLARLAEAYHHSGVTRRLVIVGPDGWQAASVRKLLDHKQIVVLPYQSRERLAGLMRHARALLFPSLSEGFGLPIAEAMSLGVPVMTSAQGATAEVAGDATLLVDPYNIDSLASAIRRLDDDDALCDRLGAAGLRRSMEFRTLPYAQRLIALYTEVLGLPSVI